MFPIFASPMPFVSESNLRALGDAYVDVSGSYHI